MESWKLGNDPPLNRCSVEQEKSLAKLLFNGGEEERAQEGKQSAFFPSQPLRKLFRVLGRFSEEDDEHHFQRTQLPRFPLPSGIRFVQFHPQLLQKPFFFLHQISLGFWFASLERIGLFVLVCFSPLFNANGDLLVAGEKKGAFFPVLFLAEVRSNFSFLKLLLFLLLTNMHA